MNTSQLIALILILGTIFTSTMTIYSQLARVRLELVQVKCFIENHNKYTTRGFDDLLEEIKDEQ